jgi:predicted transcriptional regulator
MSLKIENNEDIEYQIIKFIDSININEIEKENTDRILSEIKRIIKYSNLSKCNELTIKKFVKLSIHLIKYFHKDLVKKLFVKLTDENNDLINDINILSNLYSPIVSLSDKSIQFCNYFHEEESENGIKVLFDLVMDEKLLLILFESQTNYITAFLQRFKAGNSFMVLLNISKAYDKNKEKWNTLNAYQKLLDLSKNTNSNKDRILKCIMILGNIASDEDLNNFSASPKGFEYLTEQIHKFSTALADKSYLIIIINAERTIITNSSMSRNYVEFRL